MKPTAIGCDLAQGSGALPGAAGIESLNMPQPPPVEPVRPAEALRPRPGAATSRAPGTLIRLPRMTRCPKLPVYGCHRPEAEGHVDAPTIPLQSKRAVLEPARCRMGRLRRHAVLQRLAVRETHQLRTGRRGRGRVRASSFPLPCGTSTADSGPAAPHRRAGVGHLFCDRTTHPPDSSTSPTDSSSSRIGNSRP